MQKARESDNAHYYFTKNETSIEKFQEEVIVLRMKENSNINVDRVQKSVEIFLSGNG